MSYGSTAKLAPKYSQSTSVFVRLLRFELQREPATATRAGADHAGARRLGKDVVMHCFRTIGDELRFSIAFDYFGFHPTFVGVRPIKTAYCFSAGSVIIDGEIEPRLPALANIGVH